MSPTPLPLVDTYGRVHQDLRVSLTDRCNLRCTYCMPSDFADWLPGPELLSTDELMQVLDVATSLGIDGVRLTGGEPLLRADVVDVVRRINQLPHVPEVSVTTNGLKLTTLAQPLRDAGLTRVNVSLDTLDRARFKAMTFRDRFHDVLAGIKAAQAAGLAPVKVNAVLMRGVNDDEAPALLRRALDEGWRLRFIEQMPLDPSGVWLRSTMITADEIFEMLSEHHTLTPLPGRGSAPAEEFLVDGGPATVGHHRERDAPVLRVVRPAAAHRRRPAAQLPVRPRRARPAHRAARRVLRRRRETRRDRAPPAPRGQGQAPRPRHQRPQLHPAHPPHVSDRRVAKPRATRLLRWAVRRSGAAPRAERGPGEERAGVTEARVRRHPTHGSDDAGTAPPGPRSGGGRDATSASEELGAAANTAEAESNEQPAPGVQALPAGKRRQHVEARTRRNLAVKVAGTRSHLVDEVGAPRQHSGQTRSRDDEPVEHLAERAGLDLERRDAGRGARRGEEVDLHEGGLRHGATLGDCA